MKTGPHSAIAVAILLAAGVCTAAHGQTPIPKVKPIPPVKPIPKVCDPNLWGNYLRKKRIVEELLDDWLERNKKARHGFRDDLLEILLDVKKETKEHKKIGKDIKKAEQAYSDYVESRYSVTEAALKKDAAESLGKAAEAGATGAYVAELALDADKLRLAWGDYRDESAANDKDLPRIDALWQSALADLRQALAQTAVCQREREKADAQEALKDKARDLIDKWNGGGVTYRDPRGVILNEEAALHEAEQILLKQQRSGFRPTASGFMFVALVSDASEMPPTGTARAAAAAALVHVQHAHQLFKSSMAAIIAFTSAQMEFERALEEVRGGM